MNLWIRSQDKKRLTIVRDLRIYYAKQEDIWVIEDCDDLAYYKTKKRALEVLDEIQIHIEKQGQTIVITNEKGISEGLKYYGKTYEMPKE